MNEMSQERTDKNSALGPTTDSPGRATGTLGIFDRELGRAVLLGQRRK